MTTNLTHRLAPLALAVVILLPSLSACAPMEVFDSGLAGLGLQVADSDKLSDRSSHEDCEDLSDPNADSNVYACQLIARIRFLLDLTTCAEYIVEHNACTPSS